MNHRVVLNDVDGLVLISVLQAQIGCLWFAVVFFILLIWFQYPSINVLFLLRSASVFWSRFCSFFIPQQFEPSGRIPYSHWRDFLSSFGWSNYGFFQAGNIPYNPNLITFELIELFHFCIAACALCNVTLGYVEKFYRSGSDPMKFKSAKQNNKTYSESSGKVMSELGYSSIEVAHYSSPSNIFLNSIRRFNPSSACTSTSKFS